MARRVGVGNGEGRDAVLELLKRDVDLDGIVTVVQREMAAELGVSQPTVSYHLRRLVAEGVATAVQVGRGAEYTSLRIADEVLA